MIADAAHAQENLASLLAETGRPRDAEAGRRLVFKAVQDLRALWEKALEQNPPEHDAWYGYAELCLFLRKEGAYHSSKCSSTASCS